MTSKSTPTKNSNATQLIELVSLSEACEDDGSPIFRAKLQEAEEVLTVLSGYFIAHFPRTLENHVLPLHFCTVALVLLVSTFYLV